LHIPVRVNLWHFYTCIYCAIFKSFQVCLLTHHNQKWDCWMAGSPFYIISVSINSIDIRIGHVKCSDQWDGYRTLLSPHGRRFKYGVFFSDVIVLFPIINIEWYRDGILIVSAKKAYVSQLSSGELQQWAILQVGYQC
jgi:hypothetical protein